jgi:aspartate/methionine/tyrosine aminotransferase
MIRFSRRLAWGAAENALALLLDEKRASGAPLLDLTESNPTRVGLPYPDEDLLAALTDPRALRYEPTPKGLATARRAIADYYRGRDATHEVDTDDLLLTASTSEAYAWLFKLLADPGDAVLVPHPSYPLFDFLAALESVRLAPYPLAYDGAWYLDLAALQQAIDDEPAARAIIVVNPNNPTGSFLKRDERAALAALAAERGLAILADEVFADFAFAPDPARVDSLVDERDALCFTLSGISKVLGLPQMKLGWIHVAGPAAERAEARARLELIADTYLSVSAPVQHALPSLLSMRARMHAAIAGRVARNHAALRDAVAGSACQALHAEGGWCAVLRLPATRSDERWALDLLASDDVLVQPGYFYDFRGEAYLVVSLLPEPAGFDEGLRRIVARVAAAD